MSLKLNGATSGSIELDVPAAIGSDLNITIPATAGEVAVKGTDGSVDLGDVNIDSSGNVGIGTTSPAAKLHVAGEIQFGSNASYYGSIDHDAASTGANIYNSVDTGGHIFKRNSTIELMRIDGSGRLLVGTPSLASYGTINGYTNTGAAAGRFVGGPSTSDGAIVLMVDKYSTTTTTSQWFLGFTVNNQATANGVITANGASQVAFGTWSDRRLKKNIVDLPSQLDNICALRPVEFDYIESEGGGHQISFIAQEFEQIFPDSVGERPDGMKTLTGWGKTEAILVKALQEAVAKIKTQGAAIAALEAKVAALEANP